MYVVNQKRIAFHTKENKHYYEGQTIDLSHLSDVEIAALLLNGLVVEKKEIKTSKTEEKSGANNG
jgi:hypothetical protein